jgi:hypothetical protein
MIPKINPILKLQNCIIACSVLRVLLGRAFHFISIGNIEPNPHKSIQEYMQNRRGLTLEQVGQSTTVPL